jgi:hypothetical protein
MTGKKNTSFLKKSSKKIILSLSALKQKGADANAVALP